MNEQDFVTTVGMVDGSYEMKTTCIGLVREAVKKGWKIVEYKLANTPEWTLRTDVRKCKRFEFPDKKYPVVVVWYKEELVASRFWEEGI